MRSISSNRLLPTSPTQISPVLWRRVKRNGFRKPVATIRARFASPDPAFGLLGQAAPVDGSRRRIEPSSPVGSPLVRRSWERRLPPSSSGSPHGFTGVGEPGEPPSCPASGSTVNDAPSPPPTYSEPSGPNITVPMECDGYCWHQSSMRTVSPVAVPPPPIVRRDSRALTTQPSVVAPGRGPGQEELKPGYCHRGIASGSSPRMWSYV